MISYGDIVLKNFGHDENGERYDKACAYYIMPKYDMNLAQYV